MGHSRMARSSRFAGMRFFPHCQWTDCFAAWLLGQADVPKDPWPPAAKGLGVRHFCVAGPLTGTHSSDWRTSKGVSVGVKAIPRTRRLVLAAEFLGGDTGGQGQGRCDDHPMRTPTAASPSGGLVWSVHSIIGMPRPVRYRAAKLMAPT